MNTFIVPRSKTNKRTGVTTYSIDICTGWRPRERVVLATQTGFATYEEASRWGQEWVASRGANNG